MRWSRDVVQSVDVGRLEEARLVLPGKESQASPTSRRDVHARLGVRGLAFDFRRAARENGTLE